MSVAEKRIPFLFLVLFAAGARFLLEKRAFGPEVVAEVASFFVPDPLCLRLLALMISFLVVETAIAAASQIGVAVRAGVLSMDLIFDFDGLSAFPADHGVSLRITEFPETPYPLTYTQTYPFAWTNPKA